MSLAPYSEDLALPRLAADFDADPFAFAVSFEAERPPDLGASPEAVAL